MPWRLAALATADAAEVRKPQWTSAPSVAQIEAARVHDTAGSAIMVCTVVANGSLDACRITRETPSGQGQGLGQAALGLVPLFRIKLPEGGYSTAQLRAGVTVTIQIPWGPKGEVDWRDKPSDADMARVFPLAAIRAGKGGEVRLECQVLPNGSVHDCRILSEKPTGMGFGLAALDLQSKFRMYPKPDGGTVEIPIVFSLNG